MSTTTEPTPRRTRRTMLFQLNREQLLPLDLDVPEAIAEANRAAHSAFARYEEARRKAGELAEQARHAPRHDQHAAEAAALAGEDPPKPTAPLKQQKADEARRVRDAEENAAKIRVRALYDAVEDNYDAYLVQLRDPAAQAADEFTRAIPELLERAIAFRTKNVTYQCARRWENTPGMPLSEAVDRSGRRRAELDRALEARRKLVRQIGPRRAANRAVENTIPELLAALTIAIEQEFGETG